VTGELEGRPGGKNRLIREFRLFGTIGLVVVLVFGGIQIWQISLAPHTATVRVAPETDPTSADDSAEWLLGLLEVEVRLPERDDPLLVLPPGTREGTATVRGRALRNAITDGRATARARVPGSAGSQLGFALTPRDTEEGLAFELPLEDAREFQNRRVETQVAFRDVEGVMARGLFPGGVEELRELPGRHGVYTLGLYMDQLLLALQRGDSSVTVQPRDGLEPTLPNVDIDVDWFLHDAQDSRVVTLPVDLSARGREAEPPPPAETPVETVPGDPPAPDPEVVRQQRLDALIRQVDTALGRGDWDRAEALSRQAQDLGAAASTVRGWRDRIGQGREAERRAARISTLANAIGEALRDRDWDAAERDMDTVRDLDPGEPRLPVWEQSVRDGRAADRAAAAAEEEARQASTPPEPEPAPDPRTLIERTVANYARAQSTRDLVLYTRVYPGSTEEQRRTIQRAWDNEAERDFRLTVESVEIDGDSATVAARQSLTIKPLAGERRTVPTSRIRLRLARQDEAWVILAIEAR